MSKLENLGNSKDIYSIWKSNMSNFYSNVEKAIPEFHQVSTNLVQEYVKSWSNFATSAIDLQREIATKTGIKSNLPDSALNMINDSAEKLNRTFNIQNKISIASIDATKQNIKTWNENSNAFASINKHMVDSLISSINSKT